jgi:hypothetical protein
LNNTLKDAIAVKIPSLKADLVDAKAFVQSILYTDVYPRFVIHQITKNITEVFKEGRSSYKGLGDCFCFTDPLYVTSHEPQSEAE